MKRITIQDKIYFEMYNKGREVTVKYLMKLTQLKLLQVHMALTGLKRRNMITKKRTNKKSSYAVPPMGEIYVKVRDFNYAEKYLKDRGML